MNVVESADGTICLFAGDEVTNFKQFVTLQSYDTDGDGAVEEGELATIITLTGLPDDQFLYANVHLDYGEKKYNFTKNPGATDAETDDTAVPYVTPTTPPVDPNGLYDRPINEFTNYNFDAGVGNVDTIGEVLGQTSGAEDTVVNDLVWKKLKGNGGFGRDTNTASSALNLVRTGVASAIWIPYFFLSKRVKRTFVN